MSSDVPIRDDSIRLGQFLKLANLVEDGAEAKAVIADGQVHVNGEVELRRGRQLAIGDRVTLGADSHGPGATVAAYDPDADDGLPW
ncbi:RNA-binding S4 domain-containing protein [Nocardioides sp. AE5]|uniref:RNA-binding S4 domain-containing protein n=1 Tax=Nocardioides sp. AE5 TaxID=2962573 RepID=UPI002882AC7A|nr:RNA-binding S4 domain-containing protein [Nocardioides sp. AE5]MDT0200942.1 RNA-binding S4 domain-containing protein [Nocardioides sp. AE5]